MSICICICRRWAGDVDLMLKNLEWRSRELCRSSDRTMQEIASDESF